MVRQVADKWLCVAYGGPMFASSAMNNLFVTYYLDLFMNVTQISGGYFVVGQLVFMVWNAVNDPLFGWISDNFNGLGGVSRKASAISRRLYAIRYGGMLWSIAFLWIWLAPGRSSSAWIKGVHFCLSLCLYDGALSLVEVNHSALLADISPDSSDRALLNAYSAVGAALGSFTSYVGHVTWDRMNVVPFQQYALLVAAVSCIVFVLSSSIITARTNGKVVHSHQNDDASNQPPVCTACTYTGPAELAPSHTENESCTERYKQEVSVKSAPDGLARRIVKNTNSQLDSKQESSLKSSDNLAPRLRIATFLRQISTHHNFWVFELRLVGVAVSQHTESIVISSSFLLPWILTVLLTPLIQKFDVFQVTRGIFGVRICLCLASVAFVHTLNGYFVCSFLLVNRVLSELVCRICPLIMTDLVDEDQFLQNREYGVGATIIGASTFFGKTSQSLAPILGYFLFRADEVVVTNNQDLNVDEANTVSYALVLVPLCCVIVQFTAWSRYTLHGKYMRRIKRFIEDDRAVHQV